jgi:hypothetical protein
VEDTVSGERRGTTEKGTAAGTETTTAETRVIGAPETATAETTMAAASAGEAVPGALDEVAATRETDEVS